MQFSKKIKGIFSSSNSSNSAFNNTRGAYNNKGSFTSKSINYFKKSDTFNKVFIIIGAVLVTFLILYLIKKIIVYFHEKHLNAPWLIKGTRNGRNTLVINQNPRDENSITLYRSNNQKDGLEFSYSLWLIINDTQYKYGKTKAIFYKGNKTGFPNRAPGVFLHPTDNTLLIYMNTYDNILNQIDITDIPIKRWFHLSIVITQQYMDIYFNGHIKKRHKFLSMPKQNFGNVWINMDGGFDGYISKFRYYRYALTPNRIIDIVKAGPSKTLCDDNASTPPYLSNDWWVGIKM